MIFKNIYNNTVKSLKKLNINTSYTVKILMFLSVVFLTVLMFPKGESIEFDYRTGVIWTGGDIIAHFSFPIYKDERQYEAEREIAIGEVPPVFRRDESIAEESIDTLKYLLNKISAAVDFNRKYVDLRDLYMKGETDLSSTLERDSVILAGFKEDLPIHFTDREWEALLNADIFSLRDTLVNLFGGYYRIGILSIRKNNIEQEEVAIRRDAEEVLVPVVSLLDVPETIATLERDIGFAFVDNNVLRDVALKIAERFVRHNIIYDDFETDRMRRIAGERVPRTVGFVLENERIVSRYERITEDVKLRLDSFRRAKAERGGRVSIALQYVGKGLHVSIILILYGVYFFLFRKGVFQDNAKLALISLLILMQAFLAYLTISLGIDAPVEYLILIPVASMLLTIMFDSRLAFYGTVVAALIVGGIRGNDYTIVLASLMAGALAAYTVRDIKNRKQIFRSMLFIFLGYALTIIALGMERFEMTTVILKEIAFAGTNAVVSPVLTFGLLIVFERVWRITTDLTLLELSDFNHPLLRDLSQKAPGTFHHSLVMGSLSETAAEAIGANTILARVGAYYHDIGKTFKPEYFIENQMGFKNLHDKLSPSMSALILISHVKDGVELGKKHKLPKEILDFIPMHHGTTLISYFYNRALEKKSDKDEISEIDYRYPGPKPQTKETGIVMLADAVEAATRSIDEPTMLKIKSTIDSIIKTRFEDGELDECELTLKDLTKIRDSFFKVLIGIHHPRVKYPEKENDKSE